MREPRPMITLTCERCGVSFTRDAIRHKNTQAYGRKPVYCGRECMMKSAKSPFGWSD